MLEQSPYAPLVSGTALRYIGGISGKPRLIAMSVLPVSGIRSAIPTDTVTRIDHEICR